MTHILHCQFNTCSAIPEPAIQYRQSGTSSQVRFQRTLEDWHGTRQLEFCWQSVVDEGAATENALSPNFRRVLGTT